MQRLRAAAGTTRRSWRRSLQLRMVTITLLVSSLLVGAFGVLVVELITANLLRSAEDAAQEQVSNGAALARDQLRALGPPNNPSLRSDMRDQVLSPLAASPERGSGVVVALVSAPDVAGAIVSPEVEIASILTPQLEAAVTEGDMHSQIITARPAAGQPPVTYLVYGSPVPTGWGGQVQLYYLFPLTSEIALANDVRTTVLATGAALVLLLAVVTGLVTRLVVRPVRLAARTAQRLSAGLLDQRMTIEGEDDLALLGASFNQMAGNLQRQIVRLEEMSRLQRRFTSDVSHELRTPLTTVRMASDLIYHERDSYPPEVARSAELLQHELDRFECLLTDLLEISRFDAGFAALDSEATDLAPVVHQAVEGLAAVCSRAGVEVRLRLPETPVIAEVDQRRVDRILRNLIGNAIDHGEGRPVEVAVAAGETAVAVTVRDHGVGLRPGDEKLIFNRFWRADQSRARQTGGTGLGLSISMEDARLHGGWLEAWGERGRGSQFRLTLPLRPGDRLAGSPLPLVPDRAEPPTDGARARAGAGAGVDADLDADGRAGPRSVAGTEESTLTGTGASS